MKSESIYKLRGKYKNFLGQIIIQWHTHRHNKAELSSILTRKAYTNKSENETKTESFFFFKVSNEVSVPLQNVYGGFSSMKTVVPYDPAISFLDKQDV